LEFTREALHEALKQSQHDTLKLVISTAHDWLRNQPLHSESGDKTLLAFAKHWEALLKQDADR
jgi:hypothetical protein